MAATALFITWLVINDRNHGPGIARAVPVPAAQPAKTPTAPRHGSPTKQRTRAIKPVALSAGELKARAASLDQAVYWAGPAPGFRYELSRSSSGHVFIRYLPFGVKAGASGHFLTIDTDPFQGAFATAQAFARQAGVRWRRLPKGGIAAYRQAEPTIVLVAYRKLDYKIAVYDPSPAVARGLVASRRVRRIR